RYGAGAIIAARAFPFMSFDPISYASGFLKIKFRTYFIATLIGSITRCVFYAWLGSTLNPGDIQNFIDNPATLNAFIKNYSTQFNLVLTIIILVLGVAYLFYQFILMPYLKKKYVELKELEN
ncbi:MAG: VTT domain-containing protein, partial [Candidatus Hodarchaeota archaeon]